jgi:ribosomal protein S18 acetylase RimI-like enzyme
VRRPPPVGAVADLVRQARPEDADAVAPLFDAYRQFYEQPSDLALARAFIGARLERGESVIFLAERDGRAVGFVQLYPVFSSTAVRPRRLWLLNDLFVAPEARGRGVARSLMERARQLAVETDAAGLELATAHTNTAAQRLYESLGWRRDERFPRYELAL